ncbi:hypothetical protein A6A04_03790 [Paramagnetospirillum marisnigri]|uniref:UDP-N-acetylglucosamine 2-epimerase domain-containing protein n=1 Tax=Paramagnetospirillum marisnigri TaxID=1285242 RepID=A0A178MM89_9PROT|nr:UDP-N-acetylglucosamine 2-epimerase [Paramagnetospirillum marisnigri]OAN49247.1 hypothetical protein A6A04_03790 [Paramagnetospirillum marisnigri]
MSRHIAVVSVARSDYGIYRPLLRAITADPALELSLIVAATHLTHQFGDTLSEIIADGFTPAARVDCTLASDNPASIARSMGLATMNFATAYESLKPDLLVVLGDRYEMHAAACAAVPMLIPMAHIAGGAITRGAIDDSLRHSMTKLCHLHFPETAPQGQRLLDMGEAAWRVHVAGSLALDNVKQVKLLDMASFNARFGTAIETPPILVTFHPVTRDAERTADYAKALMDALETAPEPILFTYPNADTAGHVIIDLIEAFIADHPGHAFAVPHLGTQGYFSAMALAHSMVGNSSSGMTEAASFGLPVVNIGRRQEGRLAPPNVINCGHGRDEILAALSKTRIHEFRDTAQGVVNPYGDGKTAPRIVNVLRNVDLSENILMKEMF